MSDTNAPEPTMEEILASIRRIISEDDAPTPAAAETATSPGDPPEPPPAAHHEPHAEPPPHSPAHEDVLELTERVEPAPPPAPRAPEPPPPAAAPNSLGDLDFSSSPPAASAASAPAARPAPTPAVPQSHDEPLLGDGAAGRAADHFGSLHSRIAMPSEGRTLEDVVREMLRPMLKEWLDRHLPAIVEARVQDEVERISRRRTY